MAAGAVTITETAHGSVKKVVFAWTAGTSTETGTATGTTTGVYDGDLLGLTTIPAAGDDAPADNYDITLTDAETHDVLLGAGANRSTSATQHVAGTSLAGVAGSKLTLNVTNAGSANKGTAVVYVR